MSPAAAAQAVSYTFRPAVRENVPLLIGIAGPSGGGKTYTALLLAKGIAGDQPFAVIDTEAGRAKHYADAFRFDHCDLRPPFRPSAYQGAIVAADKAGYPVVVVDSFSHEHAGEGGILDWREEELETRVKRALEKRRDANEWDLREAFNMASWIKPKTEHKQMVQKLLQVRAHLILCFRAEEKIDIVRKDGKTEIVPKTTLAGFKGWIPICEKNLPFELTTSFLVLPDRPGVPVPIKIQQQHRPFFPTDKPVTEESGARLATWARGGSSAPAASTENASRAPAGNEGDPRPSLLKAIAEETAKLERQPTGPQWSALCKAICGTDTLEVVDVVPLDDLLTLLKKVVAKDQAAIARVKSIVATAK